VDENCCNWEAVDTLVLPPALCLPPLINTYSWTFAGTHRRLFPTNEGAIFTMKMVGSTHSRHHDISFIYRGYFVDIVGIFYTYVIDMYI
jgi:hypothetical protein